MHYVKKYQDILLVFCAMFFMGIIIGAYAWGIGDLVEQFNKATNSNQGGNQTFDFRIEEAKKALSERGVIAQ